MKGIKNRVETFESAPFPFSLKFHSPLKATGFILTKTRTYYSFCLQLIASEYLSVGLKLYALGVSYVHAKV